MKNLDTAVKKLREDGVIDGWLGEWADQLRLSGNSAAHDLNDAIDGDDAKDLIPFTEALLNYVFVLREQFAAFQARQRGRRT